LSRNIILGGCGPIAVKVITGCMASSLTVLKGQHMPAQGCPPQADYPGFSCVEKKGSLKGIYISSVPDVAFIIVDLIAPQELPEFILKRLAKVVLKLIINISFNFLNLRLSD
jgi:hypothetical protein